MRKILLLLAIAVLSAGCRYRPMSEAEGERTFVVAHDHAAGGAFDRSEVWISEAFTSAKAVIDVRQPVNGLIIGKGTMRVLSAGTLVQQPIPLDVVLRITNADRSTSIVIRVRSPYGSQVQMEEGDIAKIQAEVERLAKSFALSLGGTIQAGR
jgi:hypothetical protein